MFVSLARAPALPQGLRRALLRKSLVSWGGGDRAEGSQRTRVLQGKSLNPGPCHPLHAALPRWAAFSRRSTPVSAG